MLPGIHGLEGPFSSDYAHAVKGVQLTIAGFGTRSHKPSKRTATVESTLSDRRRARPNHDRSAVLMSYGAFAKAHTSTLRLHRRPHFAPGQLPPDSSFWSMTMYSQPSSPLFSDPLNRILLKVCAVEWSVLRRTRCLRCLVRATEQIQQRHLESLTYAHVNPPQSTCRLTAPFQPRRNQRVLYVLVALANMLALDRLGLLMAVTAKKPCHRRIQGD